MRIVLFGLFILMMMTSSGCNNPSGGSVIGRGNAPFLQKPAPFSFRQIRASNGNISVSWNESSRAARYEFFMGTSNTAITTKVDACSNTLPTCQLSGLDPSVTYYFDAQAINDAGSVKVTNIGQALSVGPFSISSSSAGDHQITVDWGTSTQATSYNIIYGTRANVYPSTLTNVTPPYTLTGLTNGVRYYLRVVAVNAQNGYGTTSEVNHQPYGPLPAPTGLALTTAPGQILLNWNDSAGASSYKVLRGTSPASLTQIATGVSSSNYTDTVTDGQTYFYAVIAFNGFDSPQSASQSAQSISSFAMTSANAGPLPAQATVAWPTTTGATSYDIQYGSNPASLTSTITGASSPYIFSGLVGGLTYHFRIVARNAVGAGTSQISSNQLSATPVVPIASPTGLTASSTPGSVLLNWTATTGAISYKIMRGTSAGSLVDIASGITGTTYTDSTPVNGTIYFYAVKAFNGLDSAPSSSVQIQPISNHTLSSAVVATFSSANLTWAGATGATAYDIVYGTAPGTYTGSSLNRTSPFTLTGLSGSTTYYVSVRAKNAVGSGSNVLSNELTFTTSATFPTVNITTFATINNANKAAYTVAGDCTENGRNVVVTIGSVSSTVACSALAWTTTFDVSAAADSPTRVITATHTNSGGNSDSDTKTVVKDTVNPTVAITNSPAINNNNKDAYTISGTCSENTRTVAINLGGMTANLTCTSLAWSTILDVSSISDAATISLTANHSDAAANTATQASVSVLKDTSIPSVTITSSPTINNANKAAYTFSGTCSETGRTVAVKVGATTGSVTCTLLTWTATLNVTANADSASLIITADHTDAANNAASQATSAVIKDTVNPTLTIASAPLINNANKAAYVISGTCSENSFAVNVSVGGITSSPLCSGTSWTATLDMTSIADSGAVAVSVNHSDSAANTTTVNTTVVKNTNLPLVAITSSTAINNTNKAAYPVSGTCSENGRPVVVNVGGVSASPNCSSGNWTASVNVSALADGAAIAITANHSDTVGNNANQASASVLKDTIIPTVSFTSTPVINNGNKAAYIVSGTCSEDTRNVTVTVASVSSTVACSTTSFSATLNVTAIADNAAVSVSATHTDLAGNTATPASATVVKDTANPTVAITTYPVINNNNKASYTVSGSCSENTRQVSVSVGGVTATPVCTTLAWTATVDASALADNNSILITADHTDAAGNAASQATRNVVKDTALPTVAITTTPVINNANKNAYTFSGTCSESGLSVSVKVGSTTGTATCTLLTWSSTLNVSANADSGSLLITADHTDSAGNAAVQAGTTVVKDTVIPTVAITSSPVINNNNKASYTVSGTCSENGRNVSINVGGVTDTPVCSSSAWSSTLNVTSVSDSASVSITANHSDSAGNNATQASVTVVKNTNLPTVAMTSTPVINNTNKAAYTISGTCSENGRQVSINAGGVTATPVCTTLAWSTTLNMTAVADNASVSITADHTDTEGNIANQASTTVLKDTVIPTVAITSSPVINNSNKAAYTVSGTCSENTRNVSVSVGSVNGTPVCTSLAWTITLNVTAVADSASVAVTANHTDNAANAATQASATVVKDTAIPTVAITSSPIINDANKAAYTVSGTCSENTQIVSVTVGGISASPVCSGSAWSATVNASALSDSATVSITANHSDTAGNSATQASATVLKDTSVPTVAITSSPIINNANKAAYVVSGTCSENTRTVSVNVGGVSSTPTCSSSAWSATLNVTSVSDSASVSITADHSDAAGNSATQSTASVLKDTVIPTVAITSSPAINSINSTAYPISGTCSENTRTVTVNVGGVTATPTCSSSSWSASMNVSGVADSVSVSITANHSDAAANNATQASTTVVKATGLPTVAFTSTPAINNTNKASYPVSGTCSQNTRMVSVNIGGVTATPTCSSSTWSATMNLTAVTDNASVAATADHSDAVGNNANQATTTILKDTVLPTVAITSTPVINNANKASYTVSGTCSENSRNVSINVGGVTATPVCTSLAWSSTVNVAAVADSVTLAISADHSDLAGNAATQSSVTVVKDTSNPTVTIASAPAITNANKTSYTVSGACSENTRTVSVSVGGVSSTPTCSALAWTATLNVSGVADNAAVLVTADHSDASANTATQATTSVLKDTVDPTVAITSSPSINNANKAAYTVSGTCSENTRTVSVNVGGVSSTPTCSGLTWTSTLNVNAVADSASVSITANHSDAVGNSAPQSSASVIKDTVIPTVSITAPTAINNNNDSAYVVSGSCSENTRTVSVNVGGVTATPNCSSLAWTTTLNVSGIADSGSVSITANHTDAVGNAATQSSATVSKDTTLPTVAITSTTAINNANKAAYTVTGTCSENSKPVSVNVGGVSATPSCSGTSWTTTVNVTAVSDNATISITADHSDTAGNDATQATASVLKDTVVPTVAISAPATINNSNKASYTVSGSCSENTRSVSVTVGSASGTATCTTLAWTLNLNVTAVVDNASVSITANHTDLAGNPAVQASTTTLKDTLAPTVAITAPAVINNANKSSYSVSGTCSENSRTVSVSVGGVAATPTCTGTSWTTTVDVSGVADGSISITANHSDAAGNSATQASTSVNKDTALPTVAITSPTAINNTNKAAYSISGTCSENGRTVSVNVGGVAATPTCSALAWSTTVNVTSVTDSSSVAVTADHTDVAGNAAVQGTASVLKDTFTPTVAISSAPTINNTNKSTYMVSGSCSENGRIVTVSVGGISATPTCTTLIWTASLDVSALADSASVSVTANHSDLAGNAATTASTTVVKDALVPTVAITSSPIINNANKAAYTVNGTCSDNGRMVSVNIGGVTATPTCSSGSWSTGAVNITAVSDSGTVAITADHTDVNGNNATQATASVLKDTVIPIVAITSAPNINNSNKASYTASGTCSENGRPVAVSIGGVASSPTCTSGNWTTGSINVSAAADSATLSVTANHADAAANSATQASRTVVKDTAIPTVAITSSPIINNANKTNYTVSGTCSDSGSSVNVSVGSVNSSVTCTILTWSVTVDISGNPDNLTLLITADHTDAAGNTAVQAGTTVVKDTVAPTVSIASAPTINNSNKTTYTVTGTCSENSRTVSVSIGGIASSPTCSSGSWSTGAVNVSSLSDSGTITITANHTDTAANAATTASTTVVKDTTNPTIAITAPATINIANAATYSVSGSCSENGRTVAISIGGVAATPTCSSGTWSTGAVNVSSVGDAASVTITANHTDVNGNTATQASTAVLKDSTAPTVALSSTAPASHSHTPFVVRATFSEAVTGVALTDFVVGNGSAGTFTIISGSVYEISVTPSSAGTVTVDLAASTAADAANNPNTMATQLTRTFVPPAVLTFADATTYDFGSTNIGNTKDLTVLINKSGIANASSITETGLAAPYAFKGGSYPGTGGTCTTTISGSCSIVITYTPTSAGTHNDTLIIQYNDGGTTRTVSKNLTAIGISIVANNTRIDGPAGIVINQCVAYTINSTTSDGTNANVSANQTVNLVVNNGTGTFYSNNTCATTATSTVISSGTSSKVVYFRSTTAGQNLTLLFNPTSIASSSKNVNTTNNPTKIFFTAPPEYQTNTCIPVVVDLVDANGTKAGKSVAVQVNLADNGNAAYYSDVNCTATISSVSYPAYTETKTIYVKNTSQESITFTMSDNASLLTSAAATVSFVNALSWWNTAYEKRIPITIDNTDQATTHTNIQVLVKLSSSVVNYADIQSAGQDIRFTLSNQTTTLNYDIERWNASGESLVWVRIPSVAASSTMVIYMYYKNSSATDGQAATTVWSGFSGVWNMKKSGSNYIDSTGSGKTGVPQGTIADVTGPNANAISTNGSSALDVSYNLSQVLGYSSTLSFWMKSTQAGSDTSWMAPGITGVEESGGGNDIFYGWISASGSIRISSGNGGFAASNFIVNDGSWRHVTMSRDQATGAVKFYINGVLNGSGTSETGAKTTAFSAFGVIGDTGGTPTYFNGSMDSIRMTYSVMTDQRVKAEYKFQMQTNISYGASEDL